MRTIGRNQVPTEPDVDIDPDNIDLTKLDQVGRYHNMKSVAYKTTDLFGSITKRRLWLKECADGQQTTDGNEIRLCFANPNFYLHLETQLSHVLFRTDVRAQKQFTKEYTAKVASVAKKLGTPISADAMSTGIGSLARTLEWHRVSSLWERLYPGSTELINGIRRDTYKSLRVGSSAHDGILTFALALQVFGDEVPEGPMDKYRDALTEALDRVRERGPVASLVVSKWVVMRLVDRIIEEHRSEASADATSPIGAPDPDCDCDNPGGNKPQEGASQPQNKAGPEAGKQRAQALKDLVDQMGDPPVTPDNMASESKYRGSQSSALSNQALQADVGNDDRMESMLRSSGAGMDEIVKQALQAMKQQMTGDQWLQKDAMARIRFIDSSDDHRGRAELDHEDLVTINRLRAMFFRVMGRTKYGLRDTGTEIDIPAYLEGRISGIPTPCFRNEDRGQGFRALILLDRSGSMNGNKTVQCERAARIICRALNFPFVHLDIWGFTSKEAGEVILSRFDAQREVYLDRSDGGSGGLTPIHVGVRLGIKQLLQGTENKQLFVLSDGFPTHIQRSGRSVSTQQLMLFVKTEVQRGRSQGVNVTGIMVGAPDWHKPGAIHYDMSPKQLSFMFGPKRNWKQMDPARIGQDLVSVVASSFIDFLRNR